MLCTLGFLSVGAFGAVKERILSRHAASPPIPAAVVSTGPSAIALNADRHGHSHTDAVVAGRSLRMMVDTGATTCAFSEEDAARIGINVGPRDFTRTTSTANDLVRVAPVRIGSIQIGPVTVRDVEAVVVPRGLLTTNLLGMSFLKRVREFQIAGGTMTLRG